MIILFALTTLVPVACSSEKQPQSSAPTGTDKNNVVVQLATDGTLADLQCKSIHIDLYQRDDTADAGDYPTQPYGDEDVDLSDHSAEINFLLPAQHCYKFKATASCRTVIQGESAEICIEDAASKYYATIQLNDTGPGYGDTAVHVSVDQFEEVKYVVLNPSRICLDPSQPPDDTELKIELKDDTLSNWYVAGVVVVDDDLLHPVVFVLEGNDLVVRYVPLSLGDRTFRFAVTFQNINKPDEVYIFQGQKTLKVRTKDQCEAEDKAIDEAENSQPSTDASF
jgi:hypothetical protein